MKRFSAALLVTLLMAPSPSFAWGPRRPYYSPYYGRTIVRYHDGYNGAAIAAGVLGGLATGIILDRVLFPPAPPVVYTPQPVYAPPPPPPPPRDPYDAGYSEGYSQGVARGRYERYEQGRSRGYEQGYEDAKAGRGY